jgi:hypothetical protein
LNNLGRHIIDGRRRCTWWWFLICLPHCCDGTNSYTKVADVVIEIPTGMLDAWTKDQHKPLIIALAIPFLKHRPWQAKGSPRFLALARELHFLWKTNPTDAETFLRHFFLAQRKLETMPKGVVWSVLQTALA